MKAGMKRIVWMVLFISAVSLNGQEVGTKYSIDSILGSSKIQNTDKIKQLAISITYLNYEGDQDNAKKYAKKIVSLSRKEKDNQYGIYAYSTWMVVETDVDRIITAMDSCLWYINHSTDPLARSIGYNRIGKRKTITEAIDYYLKGLKEIEGKNFWDQERESYHDIIGYYETNKDYINAIKYSKKNVEVASKSGDNEYWCMALLDYASVYWEGYKEERADQVLKICNEALALYQEHSGEFRYSYYIYTLLMTYLANAYDALHELDKSLPYAERAYEASINMEVSDYIIPATLRISSILKQKKQYAQAEKYVYHIYTLFTEEGEPNYYTSEITLEMADISTHLGKYKEAAGYYNENIHQMYDRFRDNNERINEHMEVSFQIEKKENERKLLQEQVNIKRKQNIFYSVLLGLLVAGGFFTYLFFRNKIIVSRQEESLKKTEIEILEIEKQKIEIQEKLYEEQVKVKKEEAEFKKKEAEDLQKRLVVKGLLVDHKNRTLEELKELLVTNPQLKPFKKQIDKILDQKNEAVQSDKNDPVDLENLHPDFYRRLQEQAHNKLTHQDLKYCSCIFMKMSSKEMADIFKVEPRTVRVTKYRLKQKLGLTKEEDLNQFIEMII